MRIGLAEGITGTLTLTAWRTSTQTGRLVIVIVNVIVVYGA